MKKLIQLFFLFFPIFFISCTSNPKNRAKESSFISEDTTKFHEGDTIYPFQNIDFTRGDWQAEIHISNDDKIDLSEKVPMSSSFKSSEPTILSRLRNWGFIYHRSDIASVTSFLKLFNDNSEVVDYGIVLDKNQVGLQSRKYGWIEAAYPDTIFNTLKLFKH